RAAAEEKQRLDGLEEFAHQKGFSTYAEFGAAQAAEAEKARLEEEQKAKKLLEKVRAENLARQQLEAQRQQAEAQRRQEAENAKRLAEQQRQAELDAKRPKPTRTDTGFWTCPTPYIIR